MCRLHSYEDQLKWTFLLLFVCFKDKMVCTHLPGQLSKFRLLPTDDPLGKLSVTRDKITQMTSVKSNNLVVIVGNERHTTNN
jgi:hypothetical protein